MPNPTLSLHDVSKSFTLHLRGGIVLPIVRGVTFDVSPRECVVLGGPSGAGKSSILKMIFGSYRTDGGTILVRPSNSADDPIDIATASPRRILQLRTTTLGYVSQFLRAIPRVSALDLVAEAAIDAAPLDPSGQTIAGPSDASGTRLDATEHGRAVSTTRIDRSGDRDPRDRAAQERRDRDRRDIARDTAQALLLRLNLTARLHSLPPATFSGGEQARVNIARGFAARRPILLLDEPTASLDAENRAIVEALVSERRTEGAAIVGIFHDDDTRARVATRVVDVTRFNAATSPATSA